LPAVQREIAGLNENTNANEPPVGPKRFSLSEKKEGSIGAEILLLLVEMTHLLSTAGNIFDEPGDLRIADRVKGKNFVPDFG
jgi:hypothetical protein